MGGWIGARGVYEDIAGKKKNRSGPELFMFFYPDSEMETADIMCRGRDAEASDARG